MKKILFISPGPVHKLDRSEKYKRLSEHFSGTIFTSSPHNEIINTKKICKFDFICIKYSYKLKILTNIKFFLLGIYFCTKSRLLKRRYDLVVTYDPLKTGLTGVVCSKILKAKFSPEVNGVYNSYAQYLDGNNKIILKLKKILYPAIEGFVLKHSHAVKTVFENQLSYFKKEIEGKEIVCFFDFTDINEFLKIKSNNENREILFVGFPFYLKGVDILIASFKKIAHKFPEWKLKILGWYPDKTILNTYMDNHPQIFHQPPVFFSEMPQHLARASLCVLPSRTEAKSRFLIEAMAAGKPRIVSNIDGNPTLVEDNVDGFLFENENVEDLARKLELLMGNPELRKKMGKRSRERAKKEFGNNIYFDKLIEFYKKILK